MSEYFESLERELVDAARREAAPATAPPSGRGRRRRRWTRGALIAAAFVVVGVPATAAVREVFRPVREPDGIVRLSRDTVVARGVLPERGRWELVASRSDVGQCLGIRFLDDPYGAGLGGGCGPPPGARLVAGSTGGGSARLPYVFSGVAPPSTEQVRLVGRHGRLVARTGTQDGPPAYPGAYFALETTVERPRGCVQALDAEGRVLEEIDTDTLRAPCA